MYRIWCDICDKESIDKAPCKCETTYHRERLNPEDTSVKTYKRTDDGVWDILEPCICDSPTPDNKENQGDTQK